MRWLGYDPDDRYALPVLVRHLGIVDALRIGVAVKRRLGRGEPFAELGEPQDPREALSRRQIAGAVVLWRELSQRVPEPQALALTEEVVLAAGVAFLRRSLGSLKRSELARLDEAGRQAFALERGEKFFNATMRWDEITGDRVRFTVLSCAFPRLCAAAGASALAPLFCKVDACYFGSVEPDVELVRTETIAQGASSCDFLLRWNDR